jgi:HEAT repeat protein
MPAFAPLIRLAPCSWAALVTLSTALAAEPAQEQTTPRMVREAVAVAKQLRNSENIYDQIAAAGTLVDIGDKESLQFLADTLVHSDWVLMRSAIDMMLNVAHPAGVDIIYRAAQHNPGGVFLKFLSESLASRPREDMAEFLLNAMKTDDQWVRKHALQALARMDFADKALHLRALADDHKQDSSTRAYAHLGLLNTEGREASLGALLELAATGSPDAQEAAAVGLGQVKNAETVAALQTLEQSSNLRAQIAAYASEAGFGTNAAISKIVDTIAYGKGMDPSVAAASVRRMPYQIAVQISELVTTCCKLDTEVAARLLEAWASIEGDADKMYSWGLANADPAVQMQAVWLVGVRGDRAYLPKIGPMLKHEDSGVRAMAAWTIVRILGDEYDPGVEI